MATLTLDQLEYPHARIAPPWRAHTPIHVTREVRTRRTARRPVVPRSPPSTRDHASASASSARSSASSSGGGAPPAWSVSIRASQSSTAAGFVHDPTLTGDTAGRCAEFVPELPTELGGEPQGGGVSAPEQRAVEDGGPRGTRLAMPERLHERAARRRQARTDPRAPPAVLSRREGAHERPPRPRAAAPPAAASLLRAARRRLQQLLAAEGLVLEERQLPAVNAPATRPRRRAQAGGGARLRARRATQLEPRRLAGRLGRRDREHGRIPNGRPSSVSKRDRGLREQRHRGRPAAARHGVRAPQPPSGGSSPSRASVRSSTRSSGRARAPGRGSAPGQCLGELAFRERRRRSPGLELGQPR